MTPKHQITTAPQDNAMMGSISKSTAATTPSRYEARSPSMSMASNHETRATETTNVTARLTTATVASNQSQSNLMTLAPELRTAIYNLGACPYDTRRRAQHFGCHSTARDTGSGIHSAYPPLWYLFHRQHLGKEALRPFAALHLPRHPQRGSRSLLRAEPSTIPCGWTVGIQQAKMECTFWWDPRTHRRCTRGTHYSNDNLCFGLQRTQGLGPRRRGYDGTERAALSYAGI